MDRYYSSKTISKPSRKHELVTGLEFDQPMLVPLNPLKHGHSMPQKRSIGILSGPIKQMLI